MDYEDRLLDHIDTLDLEFEVFTDTNDENSSISVVALPGSRTINEFYDGIKDKEYIHEIQIKCKVAERDLATKSLTTVAKSLDQEIDIPSKDGSYDFNDVDVTNEIFFSEATTDGWMYFKIQIKSLLTIY